VGEMCDRLEPLFYKVLVTWAVWRNLPYPRASSILDNSPRSGISTSNWPVSSFSSSALLLPWPRRSCLPCVTAPGGSRGVGRYERCGERGHGDVRAPHAAALDNDPLGVEGHPISSGTG
jgi:hypothetical protein